MEITYLNHAGTSWPKPPSVRAAVARMNEAGPETWLAEFELGREAIANFFRVHDPSRMLLTPSCTAALSIAIFDQEWNKGDRVLTSGLEHHAMHRPLFKLEGQGVKLQVLRPVADSALSLDEMESELRKGDVKMVAVTAASNVTGELFPVQDIIDLAHDNGADVLIDAAQTAGWGLFDLVEMGADMFCWAGHKGPYAPWGIGGLYVDAGVCMNSLAASCEVTEEEETIAGFACSKMPGFCDAGSVNLHAMAGMAASVQWLDEEAQADRLERARALAAQLYDELEAIPDVSVYGPKDPERRMPTVAFTVRRADPTLLSRRLKAKGLVVAGGLQCAPLAHRTIGSAPHGVIRLSVGATNLQKDIDRALAIIRETI